jgi:hypothetical protein
MRQLPPEPITALGQSRRFGDVRVTSALPLKADIHRKVRHVSKVPIPEVAASFDHLVGAGERTGSSRHPRFPKPLNQ